MKRRFLYWPTLMIVASLLLVAGLAGCQNETSNKGKHAAANSTKSEGTRIVKDAFGEVEIPKKPKRVAAIYMEDYLKALGVDPVVQWYHPSWGKQDYLKLTAPEFDVTGNIEALLAQKPDLIIVDGAVDAAKYKQYSKVAPTYRLPEEILDDPMKITKTIGDLLGESKKADEVMKQYQTKVAQTKAALKKAIGNQTVAVVRLNIGENTLALFGTKNNYIGNIYHELGLTPPPMAKNMKDFQEILSEEALPQLGADHIILFPSNGYWDSKENKASIEFLENSMWQSVPAVKKGNVHIVDRTYWQSGAITANKLKMDDLMKMFVK